MPAPLDITGHVYGDLTAVCLSPTKYAIRRWTCQCVCGNYTDVAVSVLRSGNTKSCGCSHLHPDVKTHKASNTRLYTCFTSMHSRCDSPTCRNYASYGGRGISICKEWATFEPFQAWALSSGYADNLTLDRKDVNGNYEPDNCRWATRITQSRNRNPFPNKTSKYTGVSWNTEVSKWNATIFVNGRAVQLGRHLDEVVAAKARDSYIIQNNLEDFVLNFK